MARDLFFQFDANPGFTDSTIDARDFQGNDITIAMQAGRSIYVGLHKPFYDLFFEIESAPDSTAALTWEYLNDSGGETALSVTDETRDFANDGFVRWEREIDDWGLRTINSIQKYWVKITDTNTWNGTIRACNLLFSNESDMTLESSLVDTRFKRSSQSSLVQYIAAARDEIIQRFKNSGKLIAPNRNDDTTNNSQIFDINQWDLLRPEQLRNASKYLSLSKLFFDVSSEVDDKYYQKYQDYLSEFQKAFDLYLLTIDRDDDGKEDDKEIANIRAVELSYL